MTTSQAERIIDALRAIDSRLFFIWFVLFLIFLVLVIREARRP
jgi:hypothetical protein